MSDEWFDEPPKPQRNYDKYPLTEDEKYWIAERAEFERRALAASQTGRQTIIIEALDPRAREETVREGREDPLYEGQGRGPSFGVGWSKIDIFGPGPTGVSTIFAPTRMVPRIIRERIQELKPKRRSTGRPLLPEHKRRDAQIRHYLNDNHTVEETATKFNVSLDRVIRCQRKPRGA
jgi:hypothetical protein